MIKSINRVRRLSVHEEWPSCDFCREPFTSGFTFYLDIEDRNSTVGLCDTCLVKSKQSKTGWIKQESRSE